jgi:hypothetical protein
MTFESLARSAIDVEDQGKLLRIIEFELRIAILDFNGKFRLGKM